MLRAMLTAEKSIEGTRRRRVLLVDGSRNKKVFEFGIKQVFAFRVFMRLWESETIY